MAQHRQATRYGPWSHIRASFAVHVTPLHSSHERMGKKCNQCGQVSCCSDVGRSDIPWASTNNMSYFLLFSFFSRHELYSMLPSCHPACRSAKLLISESCFYCSPPASCTLCKMRIKTNKQTKINPFLVLQLSSAGKVSAQLIRRV